MLKPQLQKYTPVSKINHSRSMSSNWAHWLYSSQFTIRTNDMLSTMSFCHFVFSFFLSFLPKKKLEDAKAHILYHMHQELRSVDLKYEMWEEKAVKVKNHLWPGKGHFWCLWVSFTWLSLSVCLSIFFSFSLSLFLSLSQFLLVLHSRLDLS